MADFFDESRIIPEPAAAFHKRLVMPVIDIQNESPAFQAGRLLPVLLKKRIRKQKLHSIRFLFCTVVEHHISGKWKRKPFPESRQTIPVFLQISLIQIGKIEKPPKRHVFVPGALMLIKIHGRAQQKGKIVFHAQIKHIFQRIDFQLFCIFVIGSVYRVVKLQQILFVMKDKAKQPVLVFAVYLLSGFELIPLF